MLHNILLLTEECLQVVPLDEGVEYILNYSEKTDEVSIELELPASTGPVFGGDPGPDMLSMAIINGLTQSVNEQQTDEKLKIELTLKK